MYRCIAVFAYDPESYITNSGIADANTAPATKTTKTAFNPLFQSIPFESLRSYLTPCHYHGQGKKHHQPDCKILRYISI